MSEQTPEDRVQADLGEDDNAPAATSGGTDIDAADLDVEKGADGDTPATNDPEAYTDDASLGGTHGGSAGGAG